ncbi:dopamine beta-hydroxylase [Elysia marginata]|uniref:Dopamine beta-hydroxylase n=1 Tax=Elysia marginata TaxID=1093978 RepID=A0AAV4JIJ4_9GAST|nr:dopamine beta-hydroxylase [Elysia marginata]
MNFEICKSKFLLEIAAVTFVFGAVTIATNSVTDGSQECEAIKEEDVKYFDIRLSRTAVPGEKTSYVCQRQPIPTTYDHEYHAVAFEPLIDNKDLVHHMLLFGCGQTFDTVTQQAMARTPHLCSAGDNACRFFLVQWSMGIEGQICSPPNAGVRFGRRSIANLSLQIHWNNANQTQGISDSSGFRVYYTRRLRKYDVANLQVGQNDLEIPPGQGRYPQTGSCSSACTSQWLKQPIFLTRAHVHMHYLGDGGLLEVVRDGQVVEEIARDSGYQYTRPPAHVLEDQVKVLPVAPLGDCVFPGFLRAFEMGMASAIFEHCGSDDSEGGVTSDVIPTSRLCSDACGDAMKEVTGHPCMQGRLGKNARRVLLPELLVWPKVKQILDQADARCPHS